MLLVHENAHELDDGERGVRVVELQTHEVRQLLQSVAAEHGEVDVSKLCTHMRV